MDDLDLLVELGPSDAVQDFDKDLDTEGLTEHFGITYNYYKAGPGGGGQRRPGG